MDKNTLQLLRSLFPQLSEQDLKSKFGKLFTMEPWGPDIVTSAREAEIATLNKAIDQLQQLPAVSSSGEIQSACINLDVHALEFSGVRNPGAGVEEIIDNLIELRDHSHIFNKRFPRTGGRNVKAKNMAELVAHIFEKIGEKVTWGTYGGTTNPSTSFGKVVEKAFEYHQIDANWKSPVKSVSEAWKKGWRP